MDKITKAFVVLVYALAIVFSTSSKPQRKPKGVNKFKAAVWIVIIISVVIAAAYSLPTPVKQPVTYSCVMPDSPGTMICDKDQK